MLPSPFHQNFIQRFLRKRIAPHKYQVFTVLAVILLAMMMVGSQFVVSDLATGVAIFLWGLCFALWFHAWQCEVRYERYVEAMRQERQRFFREQENLIGNDQPHDTTHKRQPLRDPSKEVIVGKVVSSRYHSTHKSS